MSKNKSRPFTMGKPIVGAREYISRGPSGYPETYSRREADGMLVTLLGDVPLPLTIETFLTSDPVKREGLQWAHVVNHLAKLTKALTVETIPIPAAISFWAQAIDAKRAQTQQIVN